MGDHELEEGEACDDPDSAVDVDTDLSYLDDRISLVLGDLQKAFEGGLVAEKLGSKFGHYGSFLPTHERASSILNQDKLMGSSNAYASDRKSPCESTLEKLKRIMPSSSAGLIDPKVGDEGSIPTKENGHKDTGTLNEKKNNPENTPPVIGGEYAGPPQRVKLRIKVASERKRNTTIYSHFGLSNSSSGSDDDDNDDEEHGDQRSDSDIDSSPDRTPLTMIRIMTSHHIPDGNLLSPALPDLIEEPFLQKKSLWSEKTRSPCLMKAEIGNNPGLTKDDRDHHGKSETFKEKYRETISERKDDNIVNFNHDCKPVKTERGKGNSKEIDRDSKPFSKASTKLTDNWQERQVKDAVSETGMGIKSSDSLREPKLEKVVYDYPSYEAEHVPKDFCSPYEPLKEYDTRRIEKVAPSSSHDSMNGPFDFSQQLRDMIKESSPLGMAVHGKRQFELNMEVSESKKRVSVKESNGMHEDKANSSHDGKKSTFKASKAGKSVLSTGDASATSRETTKDGSEAHKRSKASSRETYASGSSSRDQGKDSPKEAQKRLEKDKRFKEKSARDAVQDPVAMETLKGVLHSSKSTKKEVHQKDLVKLQRIETAEIKKKEKLKEQSKCELSSKEASRLNEKDRLKELSARDTVTLSQANLQTPLYTQADASEKPVNTDNLPPSTTADVSVQPIIITENWVQCDACEIWRLLPPGVESTSLPKRWSCKMQRDWLQPGMNKCSVPEPETTEATRSLYHTVAYQSASVAGQAPVSGDAPTVVPSAMTNISQDTKVIDKNKLVLKKRKVPPVSLNETTISKSKVSVDASQDITHTKPNVVEINTVQEPNQTKVAVVDLTHAQTGEEKRKIKGRERDKDRDKQKEIENEREKARDKERNRERGKDKAREREERERSKCLRANDGASPLGKEHGHSSTILKEAKDLKHRADKLVGKGGMELEVTGLYLQASLKFLQAASMMESGAGEHNENLQSLNIYVDTAKLCEFCAVNYERTKHLAAAALAYKCSAVARMRVVQAKSSSIRDKMNFLASSQQVAPNESPNSSVASDLDNLNTLTSEKLQTRGGTSPTLNSQMGGAFTIPARSRANFNRILEYAGETIAAMEALTKSSHSFGACEVASSSGMDAAKKVMDYGFHDVESLVRLVREAMEAMGC